MKLVQKLELAHRKASSFLSSTASVADREQFVVGLLKLSQPEFEKEVKTFMSADSVGGEQAPDKSVDPKYTNEAEQATPSVKKETQDPQKPLPSKDIDAKGSSAEPHVSAEEDELDLDLDLDTADDAPVDDAPVDDAPADIDAEDDNSPSQYQYDVSVDIDKADVDAALSDFKQYLVENSSDPEAPSDEDLSEALATLEKKYGPAVLSALILKADDTVEETDDDDPTIEIVDPEDTDPEDTDSEDTDSEDPDEFESADSIAGEQQDNQPVAGYDDSAADQNTFTSSAGKTDKESPVDYLFGSAEEDLAFMGESTPAHAAKPFVASAEPKVKPENLVISTPASARRLPLITKRKDQSVDKINFDVVFGL